MIPNTIHYCWFGTKPLPSFAKTYLKSWKDKCPNYSFILWNEKNFDINKAPLYVKQAWASKNYGFVADYVRFWAVYNYGGIYLDIDVELIKNFDELIDYDAFFGFESVESDGSFFVATGLGFGSIKHHPLIKRIIEDYEYKEFVPTPSPQFNRKAFEEYGVLFNNQKQIISNVIILPSDYLCPTSWWNDIKNITCNTISIHHFAKTWGSTKNQNQFILLFRKLKKKIKYKLWPR